MEQPSPHPMTDLTTQIDAILHGAAFAPISAAGYESFARAFLRITGPDATRWLNGMVTNNIKNLAPGEGNYNFLLNAQGRILGDCTIYREPGEGEPTFLLETDNSQLETLHQTLDKFIIMDDVELIQALFIDGHPSSPNGIVLVGLDAPQALTKWFSGNHEIQMRTAPAPGTLLVGMANGSTLVIAAQPESAYTTYEIWFPDQRERDFELDILRCTKMMELSPEALEAYRILSGTPKYGTDIRNTDTAKDLPQETAQTHALNFNKGCYLGQEIVERIHSRGQVHRTFTPFTLTGSLPEQLPAPLEANGKSAGEITSAVQIGDTLYALGYARREALDTHATLTYTGGTATPRKIK